MKQKKVYISFFGIMKIKTEYGMLTENEINSNQMKKLIAYLVLNRKSLISADILTAILWPQGNDDPYASLRGLVHRLKKLLKPIFCEDDFIIPKNGSYIINPYYDLVVDAEQLYVISKYKVSMTGAKAFLDNSSFPFIESLANDIWGLPVCTYYNSQLVTYICTVVTKMINDNDYDDAIKYATKGLVIDHMSEELHLLIIKALIRKGCRKLALNHYENTITMFQNEYGITPTKNFLSTKYKIFNEEEM